MAGSRTYRCHALVLDTTKLGETDLIVTMLADSGRQLRAVAKGARKPGGKLAARMQPFGTVDALLSCGRNLDVVSQAQLVEAPLGSAPEYEVTCAASAVVEVAKFCCFEDADDPFVFAITARVLECIGSDRVASGAQLDVIVAAYVFKLLSHVGYRPDYSCCVACGDEALAYFSATAGGLLCSSCASSVAGAVAVSENDIAWLRAMIALRFDELLTASIDYGTSVRLLELAHVWAATHLDCRLRALEFLLGR